MNIKSIHKVSNSTKVHEQGKRNMTTSVIGGNLAEIEAAATRMSKSGDAAITTGEQTKMAADNLETAITQAMSDLTKRFNDIGVELRADIAASHKQLQTTNWTGDSQKAAATIKADLEAKVGKVIDGAEESFRLEETAFKDRAGALVAGVEDQFKKVMVEVQTQYGDLAEASRRTAENLAQADATIQMR